MSSSNINYNKNKNRRIKNDNLYKFIKMLLNLKEKYVLNMDDGPSLKSVYNDICHDQEKEKND
jgi:hypothetical protein